MKKHLLSLTLALTLCFSFVSCKKSDELGTEKESTSDSSVGTTVAPTKNEEQQKQPNEEDKAEMCWDCGEVPITGSGVYCSNCKCMLCDQPKMHDGYLYCIQHNCNHTESACKDSRVTGSQYCVNHKCAKCVNKVWPGSQFCGNHK